MSQMLLLGDEALAQGALDAGLSGCYAYPGTPSTEIMEYVQASAEAAGRGVHRQWSANEKSAMEEAIGMSYAGRRAMACMKHVGLNVAADGFVNSAVTGTHGGLLVAVADDPSMHSSQNEQDSRFYAGFAMVPCLEPASQQEAYDMARYGFDLSEAERVPVLLRLTTRLAHSRANVSRRPPRAPNAAGLPGDRRRYVLLPAIARENYAGLVARQDAFLQASENSPFHALSEGTDRSLGIVACGIAYNYLMEVYGTPEACPHPVLKMCQYPVPRTLLATLVESCERVLVLEEGAPMLEQMLHGPLGPRPQVLGRLSGHLPRTGELTPGAVAVALGLRPPPAPRPEEPLLRQRPPRLCEGCPHIFSYRALLEVIGDVGPGRVFGDIGCYTLGALPPFDAIDSCVDMGASISMAKGAADAGLAPAVAVIGDSTFTHSGLTPLLDAIWENANITVFILDNDTTGMTGGQDSVGKGKLEQICTGLGVPRDHVRVIVPSARNHEENVRVLREEICGHDGVSVVIARRECIQTLRRRSRAG
ncbi:MAG: indolepyruvate ferredoxin oxidoreductase subunit alpha [Lentisphaeria bacterium]|nr:indolepyruvate ferredoxin oxidoreductase subunit alpha [Lentisphaeria bacterium]